MITAVTALFLMCIAPADAAGALWRKNAEALVWSGTLNSGGQIEKYQSKKGTWTILIERGGKMCIAAAGNKAEDKRGVPT